MREQANFNHHSLMEIYNFLKSDYPNEWLLHLEILEISKNESLNNDIRKHLNTMVNLNPNLTNLINEGIEIIEKNIHNEV
jgi:phenylalanine-4-hydroxylase